jgi:hypothetical protein
MARLVNLGMLRAQLPKQLEVVKYNRTQYERRLASNCEYLELTDWTNKVWRAEKEADRLDTLIRECEWGERMPPHP